jgi:hypothetical protein
MKTHREMLFEATQLELLGGQLADKRPPRTAGRIGLEPASHVLKTFPESALGVRRWIEAVVADGAVEYRLMEEEDDEDAKPDEAGFGSNAGFVLGSNCACDALKEGYELGEIDRLTDGLTPFMERVESGSFCDVIEPEVVKAIEALIGVGELAPAACLRARDDIVEFLAGRLNSGRFITAAIERQARRDDEREIRAERQAERIFLN